MQSRILLDKIWHSHEVAAESFGNPAILYIDCHLVYEVTSSQAFTQLRQGGLRVRRPDKTFGNQH
jgi:3-isopropylmalate/(R)-2-methylmalate dehydratase large subunit